jgi:hypothetical protein
MIEEVLGGGKKEKEGGGKEEKRGGAVTHFPRGSIPQECCGNRWTCECLDEVTSLDEIRQARMRRPSLLAMANVPR